MTSKWKRGAKSTEGSNDKAKAGVVISKLNPGAWDEQEARLSLTCQKLQIEKGEESISGDV